MMQRVVDGSQKCIGPEDTAQSFACFFDNLCEFSMSQVVEQTLSLQNRGQWRKKIGREERSKLHQQWRALFSLRGRGRNCFSRDSAKNEQEATVY